MSDQLRDQVLGDRVRVQMVADGGVDPYQRMGHQSVVGDVAVALVVRGEGAGGAPLVAVPGADDAVDPAAVPLGDLLGAVALDRTAEGVADRRADQGAGDPFVESGRRLARSGRHVRIIPLWGPVPWRSGVRRGVRGRCR